MTVHPTTQILSWCLSVFILQRLAITVLLLVTLMIVLLALRLSPRKLMQLLKRTRWVMLSILLIYAYTTPGHALWNALGLYSPTLEGLYDGASQGLRLLAALSGLAVLLDRLHRNQLISGLYTLFAPLGWLRISRERLAVRLALTLHYAEIAMLKKQTWQQMLQALFKPQLDEMCEIALPRYGFSLLDLGVSLVMLLLILGVLW